MQYVVWGIGMGGMKAVDFLGINNIEAFIDENKEYQYKNCCGKPIVDFLTYKRKYNNCFMVITPKKTYDIIDTLNNNKVDAYMLLSEIYC